MKIIFLGEWVKENYVMACGIKVFKEKILQENLGIRLDGICIYMVLRYFIQIKIKMEKF